MRAGECESGLMSGVADLKAAVHLFFHRERMKRQTPTLSAFFWLAPDLGLIAGLD